MKKLLPFVIIMLITFIKVIAQDKPSISYTANNVFTVNEQIKNLYPNNNGAAVLSYIVTPILPDGLKFDVHTGVISGTPTVTTGAISYIITAIGAVPTGGGSPPIGIATIQITINPGAPKFTYDNTENFTVGTTIPPLQVKNTFEAADGYTIQPDLPKGLLMDKFGTITGTPLVATPAGLYMVTATNITGTATYVLKFAVVPMSPYITYSPFASFIVGVPLPDPQNGTNKALTDETTLVYSHQNITEPDIKPTLTPTANAHVPINYSISPALPIGLTINNSTGNISGMPTTVTPATKYTVTATYSSDPPSTSDIVIAVVTNPDIVTTPATISFVGQGDIQQSLTNGAKIPANTGIGVIYRENSNIRYKWLHHIEIDFSVNVASTVDTIKSVNDPTTNSVNNKSAYGNSVLLPLNSGEAFSFRGLAYFTEKGPNLNYQRNAGAIPVGTVLSGLDISVQGSNRNWEYDSNDKTKTLIQASQLSVYTGLFHEFITPTADNGYGQNASVTIGVGYSGRFIMGDVAQVSNSALRQNLLGTTQTSFNGYEIKLGLRFYNIQAEVHLPFLKGKLSVPGLSGAQPYTFIGFTGGFPIDLTKKAE